MVNFIKTDIKDVFIIEPMVFNDSRGFLFESYHKNKYREHLGQNEFVQDNFSFSKYGTLRGLHFQSGEFSQAKLVSCIKGKVLDVIVDLREDSETFGESLSVELDSDSKRQLYVPRYFAHGFVVLSDEALFHYKCDNIYSPKHELGINYEDEDLAINWRIPKSDLIISEKDKMLPCLKEFQKK